MDITIKSFHFIGDFDDTGSIRDLKFKNDESGILHIDFKLENERSNISSTVSLNKSEAIAVRNTLDAFIASGMLKDEL